MPVMFKGREVRVGDVLWFSPIWLGSVCEYRVISVEDEVFSIEAVSAAHLRRMTIQPERRDNKKLFHWEHGLAEMEMARSRIIPDIERVVRDLLAKLNRGSLWVLHPDALRRTYDVLADTLLLIADAEQEKEQSDG